MLAKVRSFLLFSLAASSEVTLSRRLTGTGEGVGRDVHQHEGVDAHRQMVRISLPPLLLLRPLSNTPTHVLRRFGESNKLVAALFSLAQKLQPSIIFIDEIDSFLRERSRSDHEVTGMMYVNTSRCSALRRALASGSYLKKAADEPLSSTTYRKAEFMTLWDGLTTTNDTRILVLGATNRPNDIDSAILRRMPKRFSIRLPDAQQRRNIFALMLKDLNLEDGFDTETLVRKTDGLSGSDLKEACRNAAMVRFFSLLLPPFRSSRSDAY